jgi:hypothetical protein
MCIKWIVCNVPASPKINLSSAQEKWICTKSANGFIAQAGGWKIISDS